MSDSPALPLALTLGEPAGIGPDLTIQLWRRRVELRLPVFYLIADPEFIRRRARVLGLDVALSRGRTWTSDRHFRARLADFTSRFTGHRRAWQARRFECTRRDRFDPSRGG